MNPEARKVVNLSPHECVSPSVTPQMVQRPSGLALVDPKTDKVIRSFRTVEDARELFPEAVEAMEGR